MKNFMKLSLVLIAILSFSFTSCQKSDDITSKDTTDQALLEVQENSFADMVLEDIENIGIVANADQESMAKSTSKRGPKFYGDCAEVTRTYSKGVYTMTIDFGDGCEDSRGKVRRGKIIVTHKSNFWAMKTKVKYTFEDYYINDNKVEGEKIVERMAFNSENDNPISKLIVDTKIILSNERGIITRKSQKQREWLEGFGTSDLEDNVVQITGKTSGKHSNGVFYVNTIIEPLIRKMSCDNHFVQGVVEMKNNLNTKTVNYGDGECDDFFEVTRGDKTHKVYWE